MKTQHDGSQYWTKFIGPDYAKGKDRKCGMVERKPKTENDKSTAESVKYTDEMFTGQVNSKCL